MNILPLFVTAAILNPLGTHPIVRPDSVIHDSIYALAVNPKDYPDDPYVWLLDEGVYRIEPDGKRVRSLRQVIQILKPRGASAYREQAFSWNPDYERLKIDWIRVVKPSGEIISGSPEQVQESDVPASFGVPTYTAAKVKRMSLSGLDSGTIVDIRTTTEFFNPAMPGNFFEGWRVTPAVPVRRSLLVVDVPTGFKPRIVEKNLDFTRTERTAGGRTLYSWATDKIPRIKPELFAPDTSIHVMRISVSPAFDWAAIGKWYAPTANAAFKITPAVSDKVAKLTAGAKTRMDSIAAIQHWVAHDIRYVAVELGRGGYVPRDAETVMRTGFGDCKDKTMLFLAALRSIGITGYPVLLNAVTTVDESTPSVDQFNHMIAAVQTDSGLRYTDLTVGSLGFGVLPMGEDGKFGVIVRGTTSDSVHIPKLPKVVGGDEMTITGTLSPQGTFSGYLDETISGSARTMINMMFSSSYDSAGRAALARMIASNFFEAAEADSLSGPDSANPSAAGKLHVHIKTSKPVTEAADMEIFTNPFRPFTVAARIADELEKAPARTLPFDAARILPPTSNRQQLRMKLPPGWHATLPKAVSYSGAIGKYESTYAQDGDELVITRTMSAGTGVLPASQRDYVIASLRQIAADNNKVIVIKKN